MLSNDLMMLMNGFDQTWQLLPAASDFSRPAVLNGGKVLLVAKNGHTDIGSADLLDRCLLVGTVLSRMVFNVLLCIVPLWGVSA